MHVHHASGACHFRSFLSAVSVSAFFDLEMAAEYSMTKFKTSLSHHDAKILELRDITDACRAPDKLIDGNAYSPYHAWKAHWRAFMASLTVTTKGQVTLKRDLLKHLGVEPGERIDIEKLPGGELRIRAAQPTGTIDDFLGLLAGKTRKVATIEEMNEAAAAGWAADK
jgi:bifunctional DNA-binding transcriptional regulator/antitoxin component of YhaV-PrlF toxin-antitoxin module